MFVCIKDQINSIADLYSFFGKDVIKLGPYFDQMYFVEFNICSMKNLCYDFIDGSYYALYIKNNSNQCQ